MYYVKGHNQEGKFSTVHLDGEEEYSFVCKECGTKEPITMDEFYDEVAEFGVYEGINECTSCSNLKRETMRNVLKKIQDIEKEVSGQEDIALALKDVFATANYVWASWYLGEGGPELDDFNK